MIPAGLDSMLGDGDVALVTGSTSGIGREVALNLAETGATVLVHGRDAERARETVATLRGESHEYYCADFADLAAVDTLADRVLDEYDRLDCLVNNAGTWQGERHLVDVPGADGVELAFTVNHLAPFLLTCRLADRLAGRRGRDAHVSGDGPSGGSVLRGVLRGPRGRPARRRRTRPRGPAGTVDRERRMDCPVGFVAGIRWDVVARWPGANVAVGWQTPESGPATSAGRRGW